MIEKTYQPKHIEQHCYRIWEESGYFQPAFIGNPYCIMLPPPNVTGTLHMGHGFQISLMDALIRYHRMQNYDTLWQVGTDHAGIATQMVVELQLLQEGKSRGQLGRKEFIKRVWQWKEQSDGTIKQQLRRMGASVDWSRERFSLDEGLAYAVQEVFIQLYQEGLIYRGQRLVNWDPALLTAVSDLEVVTKEEEGQLWYIRYPLVNDSGYLVVATTRPETMLGDTAVAVHPNDPRYQPYIGKQLQLPLTERTIPVIADTSVAPEFATGCVKITPAHDFNDYATGQRHGLPMINIFTSDARLNQNAPSAYQGLNRFAAREKIVAELTDLGLIAKVEPHKLNVPRGEKSGAIIEPYLTRQWFVKAKPLAEPAISAVKEGQIKFVPESWTKIYYQWLENIQDWCISRQLWWGHQIPAWYDSDGNIYVGHNEDHVRQKYDLDHNILLKQDDDVLDTWFSAALWPFATLGWPKETSEFQTFYPTSVLVTGFDIIFFWVARMIMMGLKFTGMIPFQTVYITGLVRDSEGQKMSKSKGNTLDPIDLIDGISLEKLVAKRTQNLIHRDDAEKIATITHKEFPDGIPAFGTDSLRFTYYALASTGRDVRFDLGRIEGYRNFCNKLWNASRYVLMNAENKSMADQANRVFSLPDHWILSLLQKTIQKVHRAFQNYRFDLLAQTIYEFIWNEYCDWYLELSKTILYSTDASQEQKATTLYTLIHVLETILRVTHPLMPFITEEIWQRVAPLAGIEQATIMLQPYPQVAENLLSEEAEQNLEWLKTLIVAIRNIRGEMNIAPNKLIPLLLNKGTEQDKQRLIATETYIKALAKVSTIDWLETTPPPAATALVNELEILIPMADLIDKQAEVSRLNKEITKLQHEIDRSLTKLNNPNYLNKAPTEIVEQEKQRASDAQIVISKLREKLSAIEKI
jgi:valyl-tRNA synthetase